MTYFDDFEYFVTFSFIMDSDAVRARADTVDLVISNNNNAQSDRTGTKKAIGWRCSGLFWQLGSA